MDTETHENIKADKPFGYWEHVMNYSGRSPSPYQYLREIFIKTMYISADKPKNYRDYPKHEWNDMLYSLRSIAHYPTLLAELRELYTRYNIDFTWDDAELLADAKEREIIMEDLSVENRENWLIEKENLCKWLDKAVQKQLPDAIDDEFFMKYINDSHRIACCYTRHWLSKEKK